MPAPARCRLTVLLADDVADVPTAKIAKTLRKKYRLTVIEVLAERSDRGD